MNAGARDDDDRPSLEQNALPDEVLPVIARVRDQFRTWLRHGAPPFDGPLTLPSSSTWIAQALDAAALRDSMTLGGQRLLPERSFRRLLQGAATRVARTIIPGLVRRAFGYEPVARDAYDPSVAARVLEETLRELCVQWDNFATVVAASGVSRQRAIRLILRALLPDLAVRRAAGLTKAGASRLGPAILVAPRPFGAAVDHLLTSIGCTRKDLHDDIPARTLAGWCSGESAPSDGSLYTLTRALIRLERGRPRRPAGWVEPELRAYLRLARTAHVLRRALEDEVGSVVVIDLMQELDRMTSLAFDALRSDAIEDAALIALLTRDHAEGNETLRSQAAWHAPTRDALAQAAAIGIENPIASTALALAVAIQCEDTRVEARAILRAAALEAMLAAGPRCGPGQEVVRRMIASTSDVQLRRDLAVAATEGWQARALDWLAKVFVLEVVSAVVPAQRERMDLAIDAVLSIAPSGVAPSTPE